MNCPSGIPVPGSDPTLLEQTFLENLRYSAVEFAKHGIHLMIEAINTRDMPGFHLNTYTQAFDIIEKVGSDNLSWQFDIYHMQVMEGDLANTLATNLHRIGHLQLAENPGRNEPGTGEINYPFLFRHIDAIEYEGRIG